MAQKTASETGATRDQWTGQFGFLMAAVGSAIGLGNIWRFPGVAYSNGGGAFLLPYLFALLGVGIPILLLDYALGHKYRGSAPLTFKRLHAKAEFLGWWQVMVSAIITVYYAVVIAWSAAYAYYSVNLAWKQNAQKFFLEEYLQLDGKSLVAFTPVLPVLVPLALIWILVILVLSQGVSKGVEAANKLFLPLLVVLFVAIVVRALFLPGAMEGINEFFRPDWAALLNGKVWLAAVSQIFFSMSIAFGIMLTYASYLPRRFNLTGTGLVAGFANSSFEILAGIGVFATLGFMAHQEHVTVAELDGISGPILSFVTFPTVIAMMPGGALFGILFFTSLTIAGVTSLLSLLQLISGSFQDKFGWSAKTVAVGMGVIMSVVSVAFFATTTGLTTLDVVDSFINNIGVVTAAIAMVVLAFVVKPRLRALRYHLNATSSIKIHWIWEYAIGVLAPLVLSVILFLALVDYLTVGYGGYGVTDPKLLIFGWGSIGFAAVSSAVLTWMKWSPNAKHEPIVRFAGEE
ncbi:Sodium:neurotransmitter symporter family protein [Gleimia coleocanis DSM 15436]|uniref:Sodium:neurotransmitter symporter family protein n=1 Tax=Gleimia coleocanis DSM 15436 TaxID=525245 RepID=C0W1W3_9ACTO|nr:sodium-dependent transporter [Gleimia coleocanis]EEH63479.1 Sodium:neurotransmitter symporter family protein [Gleimia coleocanis DSM 15436]